MVDACARDLPETVKSTFCVPSGFSWKRFEAVVPELFVNVMLLSSSISSTAALALFCDTFAP